MPGPEPRLCPQGAGEPWENTEQGRGRSALGPCGNELEAGRPRRRMGQGLGERVRPEPGLSGRKGGNRIESLDTRDRAGDRCGEERGKEALTSTHRPLL